jgi:hypothetical protein
MFPADVLAALEQMTERLLWTTRIEYVTRRDMTVERDGMSQDYSWGPRPGTYVQEVKNADADKILSGGSGQEFRVLNHEGWQPCNFDPIDRFIEKPLASTGRHVEGQAIAKRLRSMEVKERTEKLTGVTSGPGFGPGTWTPIE